MFIIFSRARRMSQQRRFVIKGFFGHLGHLQGWLSIWHFICPCKWASSMNIVGNIDKKVRFGLVSSNHNFVDTGIGQCRIQKNTDHIVFSYLHAYSAYAASNSLSLHMVMNVVLQYIIVHVATVFRGFLGGICSQADITRMVCFCLILPFINLCHTTH